MNHIANHKGTFWVRVVISLLTIITYTLLITGLVYLEIFREFEIPAEDFIFEDMLKMLIGLKTVIVTQLYGFWFTKEPEQ